MKKAVRMLHTRVDRVHREVQRQLHMLPEAAKAKVQDLLQRTGRILTQRTKDVRTERARGGAHFQGQGQDTV
jgi:transposase, IS5 family